MSVPGDRLCTLWTFPNHRLCSEVARVATPAWALDIKVEGNLAAIGVQGREGDFGLVLVDISDPPNPRVVAEFSAPGWHGVHNLYLYKERAYLAHTESPGLTILDISDPANPVISGSWDRIIPLPATVCSTGLL